MASREQWVNLPLRDEGGLERAKFMDAPASVEHMGRAVYIEAEFDRKTDGSVANLHVHPGGDNATAPEVLAELAPQTAAAKAGLARFRVLLSSAGGDTFTFRVKDAQGTEVALPDPVENRRLLYYQVIRMQGMSGTESILGAHIADELWSPAKKYFTKLVNVASLGEMSGGRRNYDLGQQSEIPTSATASYSRAKDPYCFALILVDQLAASAVEPGSRAVVVGADVETLEFTARERLWLDLDPADTPEARWFISGSYEYTEGDVRKSLVISADRVSPVGAAGTRKFRVRLDDVRGTAGRLTFRVKVVTRFRTGLSFGSNFICVATRSGWNARSDAAMRSTFVHEAGHKIGMVPSSQSTYYSLRGGHCNHATDLCVMYGSIHAGRDDRFCPVCAVTVRGLNLDARALPGFSPP